ncbi:MAG TPA: hypothetical protein GX704_05900 [Clostridiales bacterium]|jgi:hypothetical protein|nr:hypothetical protein [Clostridiales bacterium]
MGFGLLFIAHLTLFFCRGVDVFPDVFGYLLILFALSKLRPYAPKRFGAAVYLLYAALPISALNDGLGIYLAITKSAPTLFKTVVSALSAALMLAVYVFIILGIIYIARDVSNYKIERRALRSLVYTGIFAAMSVISMLTKLMPQDAGAAFNSMYILFGIFWALALAVLIYSCYMRICAPGDEDMPEHNLGPLDRLIERVIKSRPENDGDTDKDNDKKERGSRK